jgi:predicted nuclease with TOPRIM domain
MADEKVGLEPNVEVTQEVANEQPFAAEADVQPAQEAEEERYDAAYVRKLRAEAAEYRRKLRELERELRKRDEEKLSETERMRTRLSELERELTQRELELREHTLRYETMLRARELGIIDPDAAYRLLDLSGVEYDESGRPTNIEKLLRELVRKRPYLAGQAASVTNPSRTTISLEDALKSGDIRAINQAFEAALRATQQS